MEELLETQKYIIGSILMDEKAVKKIYNTLFPEYFTDSTYRCIYKTILYLYNNGLPINVPAIAANMVNADTQESQIVYALKDCITNTVTSAQISYHAKTLVDNHKRIKFREIVNTADTTNINDSITEVINRLTGLYNNEQCDTKTLSQVFKENEYKYFNPNYNPQLLKLGFQNLDAIMGGIEDTDLVCIGARPSVGKSAFVTNVVLKVSRYRKVIFYNLEMKDKQVLDRILSYESGINPTRIRQAKEFEPGERELFMNAKKEIESNRNLIINDKGSKTVGEIRNECKFIDNLGLIVIDYLQLVKPEKQRNGNRVQEVGDVSRSLKALAMELKVPIIILSQLNRSIEYRPSKEPTLADLRESGDIEQDCNIIAFLWDIDENDKTVKGVKVAKNRQGVLGKITMKFLGEKMKFYEIGDQENKSQNKSSNGFRTMEADEETPFGRISD